jgi:hypothetical protein
VSKYAENTKVPVENSKNEIEKILKRFGADQFGYGSKEDGAVIVFRADSRHVRFLLPLPGPKQQFPKKDGREQEIRRRWRSLTMCIKAKLESVATGIETFEESFLSHIVLPNGLTMSEVALPQIKQAYETGSMPPLLGYMPNDE